MKYNLIIGLNENDWEFNGNAGDHSNYLQLSLVLLTLQIRVLQNELIQNSRDQKEEKGSHVNALNYIKWNKVSTLQVDVFRSILWHNEIWQHSQMDKM